jgi:hypothetical protein
MSTFRGLRPSHSPANAEALRGISQDISFLRLRFIPLPKPQAVGPPFVGCSGLLIPHIFSYPEHRGAAVAYSI